MCITNGKHNLIYSWNKAILSIFDPKKSQQEKCWYNKTARITAHYIPLNLKMTSNRFIFERAFSAMKRNIRRFHMYCEFANSCLPTGFNNVFLVVRLNINCNEHNGWYFVSLQSFLRPLRLRTIHLVCIFVWILNKKIF